MRSTHNVLNVCMAACGDPVHSLWVFGCKSQNSQAGYEDRTIVSPKQCWSQSQERKNKTAEESTHSLEQTWLRDRERRVRDRPSVGLVAFSNCILLWHLSGICASVCSWVHPLFVLAGRYNPLGHQTVDPIWDPIEQLLLSCTMSLCCHLSAPTNHVI